MSGMKLADVYMEDAARPENVNAALERRRGGGATMTDIDRFCEAELVREEVGFDEAAEKVIGLHLAAEHHAAAAVWCAAAAGAVMLQKKAELGHGNGFTEWKQNLMLPDGRKLSAPTADRYIALADQMAVRLKLYFSENPNSSLMRNLTDVTNLSQSERSALLQPGRRADCQLELRLLAMLDSATPDAADGEEIRNIVHEVTSGYSLTQLYFDWGILKDRRQETIERVHPDIDHGSDGRSPEQHQWDRIKTMLLDAMARKTYAGLDQAELNDAKELLYDAYNEVLECWQRG